MEIFIQEDIPVIKISISEFNAFLLNAVAL